VQLEGKEIIRKVELA